jgi:zinc protease
MSLIATTPALVPAVARAADDDKISDVQFEKETLANGLRVIYAPLRQAPVVHVQVLYHVGSKDEDPNRQGFAHMFEHMMFRGSAHVKSEQHMKLINGVGGDSNASTYVDWTRYVNTIPSNHLQMALWLESDRMASFRVNDEVFTTERNVVAEEWRLRTANPPYGTLWQDFFKAAYKQHHYKWTTIGDMDQLKQSTPAELQQFFNTYYVPNNAVLVIAGDFDVAQAKQWVKQYYGWIPQGPAIKRVSPQEPEPTAANKVVEYKNNIPLTRVLMGFRTADYKAKDHEALELLGEILGGGRSSRLHQALVASDNPVALAAQSGSQRFEDNGQFLVILNLLPGKDPDDVEKAALAVLEEVQKNGITQEELDKAKTQVRVGLVSSRKTASSLASLLADAEVFEGDAAKANEVMARVNALTPADIQRVAQQYLKPERMTVVQYRPGDKPANAPAAPGDKAQGAGGDDKIPATAPAANLPEPRVKLEQFPADYPKQPPIQDNILAAKFERGTDVAVNGVRVIVLPDNRLPIVNFSLIMRGGGHAEPAGKDGVAGITASILSRGVKGLDQAALAADLENRGISLGASDGGDTTTISGSGLVDQIDHAIDRARQLLLEPTFPEAEFKKLKQQAVSGLVQSLSQPGNVAGRELTTSLFGDSPLGRRTTPQSLASITLDDVKGWYEKVYKPEGAMLVFSGAIDSGRARQLAEKLLAGWGEGKPPAADYSTIAAPGTKRTIILVDNPTGAQATIRVGVQTFSNKSDEKYAAMIASDLLSSGIDSRLNQTLRAEKGLTYGAYGRFAPGRYSGSFTVTMDTKPESTGEAVAGIFGVLNRMRNEDVTPTELAESKQRIVGGMVLGMQTIEQQASRRAEQLLNEYPDDYYDQYPKRIGEVEASQVRELMAKYADDSKMTVVVVAPAAKVKDQLAQFGEVKVVPMPAKR